MKGSGNSDVNYLDGTKILVVMPSIPVYGMERANLQIMKMLREKRANVLFITDKMSGDMLIREIERIGCTWVNIDSGKIDRSFNNPINLLRTLFNIFSASKSINKICREFNPTHIHITDLGHFIRSFITVITTKEKVIFRLPIPPNNKLKGIKAVISKFIWRYYVRKYTDEIVCNSDYTSRELTLIGVRHKNIKVIYNCVPERVLQEKSQFDFISNNRFNVVYLGRMTHDKGVGDLYEAAKKIIDDYDDVDFYLAGDYKRKSDSTVNLENQIKLDNLEERIHLLGEVEDVFSLLSKCHLHICPTIIEEPFGIVVLEAKRQGIPSVVYPSGGILETVTHLKDGYICSDKSVNELYNGIKYFKDNLQALKSAGKEAGKSLDRFSHEKILEQWCEVYN